MAGTHEITTSLFAAGSDGDKRQGLTRCGYAFLRVVSANEVTMTALGILRTKPEDDLPNRLAEIAAEINDLLDEYQPTAVAVEQIFFQSNVRSAMSVGQVSGLVLSAAAKRGGEVAQYSPNQVKLRKTWILKKTYACGE